MGIRSAAANPAYRFVGLFAIYLALIALGYPWFTKHWMIVVKTMATGTAVLATAILSLVSSEASLTGNVVHLGPFAVEIIEECTGVFEALIFLAAVLAFPTGWVDKLIGIGLGVPILYAFNVARILVLLWVGRFHQQLFDFMHIYFWQATLILMITSVWLLWIFKVVQHEEPSAPSGT
jgi:archaeosortase B (VPXXXP-CTERM-specific)